MGKRSGFYPCPAVDGAGTQVVSQAGAVLLTVTLATVGLDRVLSTALGPWRPRLAVHDPATVQAERAYQVTVAAWQPTRPTETTASRAGARRPGGGRGRRQ